jgi:dipeptidyl aminopeptidase/acylaminoacyl peptidase
MTASAVRPASTALLCGAPSLFMALGLLAAPAAGAHPLTAKALVALDRVSDAHVSPDGAMAVYDLATLDMAANKRVHSIWTIATDGKGAPYKLADGSTPRWSPSDRFVYFTAPAKGVQQVWRINAADPKTGAEQITTLPLDVDTFRIAPDGKTLVVSMAVFPDAEDPAATKARMDEQAKFKASGKVYDKLFIRHWDTWADGTKNHLFAIRIGGGGKATGAPIPLMKSFDGDAPSKPFGGDEDYAITPDSKAVVFSARLAGTAEPFSTNFDLYSVPIDGSTPPHDFTAENKAWDAAPAFSPDGRLSAHRATKRPGFESDRFGVIVYDDATKTSREIDPRWDRSAEKVVFSGNGRSLYVQAAQDGANRLFVMDVKSGRVEPLTGAQDVSDFDVAHTPGGDVIVYAHDAMNAPSQIYALRPGHAPIQLTRADDAQLKDVQFAPYSRFSFTGWNGDTVKGWVVKPYGWQAGKSYPVVYMIHGGPQGSWEDGWSYRWNPQVWAGWGYAVVLVDFHGSTGYGQAFTDAISGHWGDRPLEDLQKGWAAALKQNPWMDGARACAAGASYGGYMIYWIAGVWNTPFKCLIDHDGVFDDRMMGYETEELWFSTWEHGGELPWQDPQAYEKFNPIKHVKDWRDPILVIHSGNDFRIPLDQGIAAFTAAQTKGIPSEFLTFPDENHWVLKPVNSLQWHGTVKAWLNRWIPPN